MSGYAIRKTHYSRGAWRVVDADTGEEIGHTDHWQDADGTWRQSVEPVCGETKSECVELVLKLLWNAGKRIAAMREEQTAARPREGRVMDAQDWNESDGEEVTCDHCGKAKRCTLTVDPYVREICPDDENNATWWCDECYIDRAGDI